MVEFRVQGLQERQRRLANLHDGDEFGSEGQSRELQLGLIDNENQIIQDVRRSFLRKDFVPASLNDPSCYPKHGLEDLLKAIGNVIIDHKYWIHAVGK